MGRSSKSVLMIDQAYVEPPTAPDHDAQPRASGEDGGVSDFQIREASADDVPDLIRLVQGLAAYEKEPDSATATPEQFREALFVDPEQRGHGLGTALLARLAAICVERGWTRLEWSVLDWNTPSIDFYRAHGARSLDDWTTFRLDGDALSRLAGP